MPATGRTTDPAPVTPVLGVASSATGRPWLPRLPEERLALALAQTHGVPDIVARILAGRGVLREDVPRILAPRLRDWLPDPDILPGMDTAARRCAAALSTGERIGIIGDYDVDGATSSALLDRFFSALGHRPVVHVPDRIREGYGPSEEAIRRLAGQGISLVITVDCGAQAFGPIGLARRLGVDVIVLDHHRTEGRHPPALAMVNPNAVPPVPEHAGLAAVGVCFLFAIALNRTLRNQGRFTPAQPEPDLMRLLDLVALGTVADVMPLRGLNRAFVAQGLRVLAGRQNPGLVALMDLAGLDRPPLAWHLGFLLGPRINAGGRIGEANLGYRLLVSAEPDEIRELAHRLDTLNRERRRIEADAVAEALPMAEQQPEPVILIARQGWQPGIVGLIAGRIRERLGKPAIAIALDGDSGRGSGRSVPGFDLGAAVIAAREAGMLSGGGGHAMAAGLSVNTDRLQDLHEFLVTRFRLAGGGAPATVAVTVDGILSPASLDGELPEWLERTGPFGEGFPEPCFALGNLRIAAVTPVGDGSHLRCRLADTTGARFTAMAFRAADSPLGAALYRALRENAPVHVAGTARNGRRDSRLDLSLLDMARAHP